MRSWQAASGGRESPPDGSAELGARQHAHHLQARVDPPVGALHPDLAEAALNTLAAADEHSLRPPFTDREAWILAHQIPGAGQMAQRQGLAILRHDRDIARAILANFGYELGKRAGSREIERRVRLESVTVPSGNDREARTLGQGDRAHIFLPATQTVDFKSMDLRQEFLEELPGERNVGVKAHAADIPERMVEDDQNLTVAIEPLEQFSKHLTPGVARVSRHFV